MSDLLPATPYHVSYTPRVLGFIRTLAVAAGRRGDGGSFSRALEEFDRRLRIYPQFGDPLSDLTAESGQIRLGIVPPLTMRYAVFEERRLVIAAALPVLIQRMPRRGS